MRPAAKRLELAAEMTAVRMTKLKRSAAYGIPRRSNTVTKGLFRIEASSTGRSAARTTIVPMKKTTRRMIVVLTASGITFSGLAVSPAATPMSSVPEKAKLTATIVVRSGRNPLGKSPADVRFESPGAGEPSARGMTPKTASPPSTMKIWIVTTLMSEKRNSPSAKSRVVKTVMPRIRMQ